MSDTTTGQGQAGKHVGLISEEDGDRRFILKKLDDDRFVRTGKQIIDAAEFEMGYEAWKSNLADFYVDLQKSLREHFADRFSSVHLFPRNGTVHLIVVTPGKQFDFDLADFLADVNIRLRREASLYGEVEASQLPENEIAQFVREWERDMAVR